jgi:5-methylcytosine-specific restriction protein A
MRPRKYPEEAFLNALKDGAKSRKEVADILKCDIVTSENRLNELARQRKVNQENGIGKNNQTKYVYSLKTDIAEDNYIHEEDFNKQEEEKLKRASRQSTEALIKKINKILPEIRITNVLSKRYERNANVAEYALRRANGLCQLCGNSAPFMKKDGSPFLEVHHILWLSKGGSDTIDNTVALCPNCHRKMHILDLENDKSHLSNLVI